MNRNTVIIAAAVVATIVGGVWLAQRAQKRQLPSGEMTQTRVTPTPATSAGLISGQAQVKIVTDRGETTVGLDLATQAELLGKLSRGECDGRTLAECGIATTDLPAAAKIISSVTLGK